MAALTESELVRRIRLQNAVQWGMALLLVPLSIGLWILSFYIFWWLFAIGVDGLQRSGVRMGGSANNISFYIALCATIVLAFDGFRYKQELFDLLAYHRHGYGQYHLDPKGSAAALHEYAGRPLDVAYLVSQFLFCAPRSTVHFFRCLASRLPSDPDTVAQAARVHKEVRAARQWEPLEQYQSALKGVGLLAKMKLVWLQEKNGDWMIRYPTASDD
jgi:hypothetical protein